MMPIATVDGSNQFMSHREQDYQRNKII